jgi:KaiC/GvpD/RAD55 family RecA-like ATPase
MSQSVIDLYNLQKDFEQKVVILCAINSRFYSRIGSSINPKSLSAPHVIQAMAAIKACAADMKTCPGSTSIVLQRLKSWNYDGKITGEMVGIIEEYLNGIPDPGPEEDNIVLELTPIVQRQIEFNALNKGITERGKRGDIASEIITAFTKSQKLGTKVEEDDVTLSIDSFDTSLDSLTDDNKLSLCQMELNSVLSGGVSCGTETVFIAPSGGGKSVTLTQCTVAAMLAGFDVVYITLEISKEDVIHRIASCLSGIPLDAMKMRGPSRDRARDVLNRFLTNPKCGKPHIKPMTPKITGVHDVKQFLSEKERSLGKTIKVVVVDYADKMTSPTAKGDNANYKTQGYVYEDLRIFAEQTDRWLFTASQSRRGSSDKKKDDILDLDDTADSIEKVRVADCVITINHDKEQNQLRFYVAKNRTGVGNRTTAWMPSMFDCSRIAPVSFPMWAEDLLR